MADKITTLTEREVKEVRLCLFYAENPHGTAGHNQMVLISKLARALGMHLDAVKDVYVPANIGVELPPK